MTFNSPSFCPCTCRYIDALRFIHSHSFTHAHMSIIILTLTCPSLCTWTHPHMLLNVQVLNAAVPKRRTTRSVKRMRMTNKYLKPAQNIVVCSRCGKNRLMHHLCLHCLKQMKQGVRACVCVSVVICMFLQMGTHVRACVQVFLPTF